MSTLWRYQRLRSVATRCLLAVIVSLLTACQPAPPPVPEAAAPVEPATQWTMSPCRFPVPTGHVVDCGDLAVPEDYDTPGSPTIHLHVAILRSSSASPAPDPLVILYGGPGANTLDRLPFTIEHFAKVLEKRDIILFDERGVGYSRPSLNCPEIDNLDVEAIDQGLDRHRALARRLAAYRRCRDRLERAGINLHAYSAAALVADIARLREVLGYDTWNVYGVSYGARLALMLMRDYPEGLRSVVLDSVYPLDIDLAAETTTRYAYALDRLFTVNEAQHPDFEHSFYHLVNELDASPCHVTAIIPQRFIFPYQNFDGNDLLELIMRIITVWPQAFPHLPGFIDDINNGNYVDLMQLVKPAVGDQMFSEGMNLSVMCQEIDSSVQSPEGVGGSDIAPRLLAFARDEAAQHTLLCRRWLGTNRVQEPQAPVASNIPTLVLRGEEDVVIPVLWDTRATAELTWVVRLTFPGVGHGVVNCSACAQEAIAVFLDTPASLPRPSCLN